MATVPRLDSIAQTTPCFPSEWTLADIHRLLGDIPLNRIVIQPPLGSATESDVERRRAADGKLFELEYGILVEKAMGWYESIIAILVSHALRTYLDEVACIESICAATHSDSLSKFPEWAIRTLCMERYLRIVSRGSQEQQGL